MPCLSMAAFQRNGEFRLFSFLKTVHYTKQRKLCSHILHNKNHSLFGVCSLRYPALNSFLVERSNTTHAVCKNPCGTDALKNFRCRPPIHGDGVCDCKCMFPQCGVYFLLFHDNLKHLFVVSIAWDGLTL